MTKPWKAYVVSCEDGVARWICVGVFKWRESAIRYLKQEYSGYNSDVVHRDDD